MKSNAKVGLIIFLGMLTFVGVYWFLGGLRLTRSAYRVYGVYTNVLRLNKGAEVRMSGVSIGVVSASGLDKRSRARVDMLIWKDIRIPKDSVARVTTGGLIGDTYVEIVPGRQRAALRDGERIRSVDVPQFDEIMVKVNELLGSLQGATDGVNRLMGDEGAMSSVSGTVAKLDKTLENAAGLMSSLKQLVDQSSPDVRRTMASLASATGESARAISEMRKMVNQDVQPRVASILEQADDGMTELNRSIIAAGEMMSKLNSSADRVDPLLVKMDAIAAQADQMMRNLNQASEGIKDITTDKEMQENLRTTLKNAAVVSGSAREVLNTVTLRLGSKSSVTPEQKAAIPEYGASVVSVWDTHHQKTRFDANYTFAGIGKGFYRIGAFDIGESTKANLQAGQTFDGRFALRYGIYASKVGVGYDRLYGSTSLLSAELYDPNDPHLDVRTSLSIGPPFSVYTGVSDILSKADRGFQIGVRYLK